MKSKLKISYKEVALKPEEGKILRSIRFSMNITAFVARLVSKSYYEQDTNLFENKKDGMFFSQTENRRKLFIRDHTTRFTSENGDRFWSIFGILDGLDFPTIYFSLVENE